MLNYLIESLTSWFNHKVSIEQFEVNTIGPNITNNHDSNLNIDPLWLRGGEDTRSFYEQTFSAEGAPTNA